MGALRQHPYAKFLLSRNGWMKENLCNMSVLNTYHIARNLMKTQADKNRIKRTFNVGDQAFIKLQPYAQTSVEKCSNHKLSFRYFGPFKIIKRINPVAYELEPPPDYKVQTIRRN